MFERFTKEARAAVEAATREAQRRGEGYVGTQHMLLGILAQRESSAAFAVGVALDDARAALHAADVEALAAVGVTGDALDPVAGRPRRKDLPFTSGARASLTRALRNAVQRGERSILVDHLLLGILDGGPGDPAVRLLSRLGTDADEVRRALPAPVRRAG
jgi:ATP-dependent Clp protease ATP-binding subunit ClpA